MKLIFSIFLLFAPIWTAAADTVPIGTFSDGVIADWNVKSFKGETAYRIVYDEQKKSKVLAATANKSASGRFRKLSVDLQKTPYLNWSWKVENIFEDIDEDKKSGDDFPARIYVVVERGLLGIRSLALNYVWASRHEQGNVWASPYTPQVRLIALNSGRNGIGRWFSHKRNLREDLRKIFGEEIVQVHAIALMTDADDHGGAARAYYGDIWLSPQ
jgi:hypothetical protein